jgi:adenylate cyclase
VAARGDPSSSTFLFADIAGYTALTEAHGDEEAADLAATFSLGVGGLAAERGGEVVKTIGDAVMVRHPVPAEAVKLGLVAAREVMAGHGFPTVRVGMHHGPALEREGDWFGATVNLAARVAALAAGGEVLVTNVVRDAATGLEGVTFEARGERRLRNVSSAVSLFAAVSDREAARESHIDPVCRMVVDPDREAGTLGHRGTEYRFCSLECIGRFVGDPDAYVS